MAFPHVYLVKTAFLLSIGDFNSLVRGIHEIKEK